MRREGLSDGGTEAGCTARLYVSGCLVRMGVLLLTGDDRNLVRKARRRHVGCYVVECM